MPSLTDIQLILLSSAAARDNASLYPLPGTLSSKAGASKSIASLVARGLVAERETGEPASVARSDGDLRFGMFITDAGLAAIGVSDGEDSSVVAPATVTGSAPAPAPAPAATTKTAAVIALLGRSEGATLAELIAETGWLPHTTRAALTILRRKGHHIARGKREDDLLSSGRGRMSGAVEQRLAQLAEMTSAELRASWVNTTASPAPRVSPAMLRLALAWEIQAGAYGGLSRATVRTLEQIAAAKTTTASLSPGMRLVREWNGKAHVVTIGEDRRIRWNERDWRSLSEVARAITGTRWSGPAFFGLKRKVAA